MGLIISSLFLPREKLKVLAQTFAATGLLILYANLFAAHAYYHFIPSLPTFLLMILTTAAAFLLAIRLEAQVVAVLGLAGGFLTPPLLSTGQDNPLGLFSYIAVLNVGLLSISLWKRWHYMILLAAVGTLIMEWGWVARFFSGEKFPAAFFTFTGFALLFLLPVYLITRKKISSVTFSWWTTIASLILSASAMALALYIVGEPFQKITEHPIPLFLMVFLVDLAVLALVWILPTWRLASLISGSVVFLLLTVWTAELKQELLTHALVFYFIFAVLHTLWPLVLEKLKPSAKPSPWLHIFPVIALVLLFVPLAEFPAINIWFWPIVLSIDLLAIAVAVLTMAFLPLFAVFFLTIVLVGTFMTNTPQLEGSAGQLLLLIGGFSVLFIGAALFAVFRLKKISGPDAKLPKMFPVFTAFSAILPFILLNMLAVQLHPSNPMGIFGMALFLSILYLGAATWLRMHVISLMALLGVVILQMIWHSEAFKNDPGISALLWYTVFAGLFFAFPFFFMRRLATQVMPWLTAALAFPLHFSLFFRAVKTLWPNDVMGLVPGALALIPLAGLLIVVRRLPALNLPELPRLRLLALFGGSAMFFITFIFPVQFEKEWITIGWALEGAALLWLFRRVPHPGLVWVGTGLLVVSFIRLANPAVFQYHPRTDASFFNWYLYAYGLTSLALIAGAALLASAPTSSDKGKIFGVKVPPVLYSLGAVLLFLLLNIEIANYFSTGSALTFHFSGNLAQDMTYSIGWGLFALAILILGFRFGSRAARYAGLGLLIVTILKLFLHDLFRLGGLYRIGSLIGLAVVLILVSFIYQKFLSRITKNQEKIPEKKS